MKDEPKVTEPAIPPSFAELTIACPNFWMRFKATQERISRVMAFMLTEATEAEAEYEQTLNTNPTQPK